MALRKSSPIFLLGIPWLVEGLALMLYPGASRWGMSFINIFYVAHKCSKYKQSILSP